MAVGEQTMAVRGQIFKPWRTIERPGAHDLKAQARYLKAWAHHLKARTLHSKA